MAKAQTAHRCNRKEGDARTSPPSLEPYAMGRTAYGTSAVLCFKPRQILSAYPEAVAVLTQAPRGIAHTRAALCSDAHAAMLRQVVNKVIITLKAATGQHPDIPPARLKAAQAVLWQDFTAYTARQRFGGKPAICIPFRLTCLPLLLGFVLLLLLGLGLFFIHLLRDVIAVFVIIVDNLAHNSEPKNSGDGAGITLIIGKGGRCSKCRQRDGSCSQCANKAGID